MNVRVDVSTSVLDRVPVLERSLVEEGQRWLYVAGCNVGPTSRDDSRIAVEIEDLRLLTSSGARVAVLTHQGSLARGDAGSVAHIAERLGCLLGSAVVYEPESTTERAVTSARQLAPGQVAVFGNSRLHPGEQSNDPELAASFARLGDRVAIGGFSKAHREHASNVGVLQHLPGVATRGLVREARQLEPWTGVRAERSVAIVGGCKIEKVSYGLAELIHTYDAVLPTGTVLNALLAARGSRVGTSCLGEDGARALTIARQVLADPHAGRIALPSHVVVAPSEDPRPEHRRIVSIAGGVSPEWAIVDVVVSGPMGAELARLTAEGGRALLAGPPGLVERGFTSGSDQLTASLTHSSVHAILLGGDTVANLDFNGPTSTGGGAALHYLARGTTPVLDALVAQRGAPTDGV